MGNRDAVSLGRWRYSDNHTNTWRTATVPRALRDRGLLPGESVCVWEAKKAFPREMPSLGSPGWVGVNQAEKGEKHCRSGGCCAGSWSGRFPPLKELKEGPGVDEGSQGCW